jgi:hypothetical protein
MNIKIRMFIVLGSISQLVFHDILNSYEFVQAYIEEEVTWFCDTNEILGPIFSFHRCMLIFFFLNLR